MWKNYLKIALRTLTRNKGYAAINIAGLAVGLACCVLALLYVRYEFSFDRFHQKSDRIYRLVETRSSPEGDQRFAQTAGPVGPTLVEALPAVENAVRLFTFFRLTVERGDTRFYVEDYLFTEPSFFEVFDFGLLKGQAATALAEPGSVVLTETTAQTYFGDEDPMGKTITVEALGEMTVTGVLKDPPDNSHLAFSMLFPFAELEDSGFWKENALTWNPDFRLFITYVTLEEGSAAAALERELPGFLAQHRGEEVPPEALALQPLTDIHLHSAGIEADHNQHEGNLTYIYVFAAIALFIVLIASINYMNLATARSTRRAREVGLRKTAGAHRGQLIGQFLGESILLTLLASLLALALVQFTLPVFRTLADRELTLDLLGSGWMLPALAALVLGVGIVAGSYPAFYLSRFQPAHVLKGLRGTGGEASSLRRSLVVVQFALSIIMIAATLVVYQQLQYVQEKKLGFRSEQMVVIDINSQDVREQFTTVKEELRRHPAVERVTVSTSVPGDWKAIPEIEVVPEGAQRARTTHFLGVDEDFLGAFGIKLAAGRGFSNDRAADSTAVLINEAAANAFGWEEPVGKQLRVPEAEFQGRVIGVVQDFHYQSLHEEIGALVIGHAPSPVESVDYFTARISGADVPAAMDHLRGVSERFDPGHPFEYHFLDEQIDTFYRAEVRAGKLFGLFAGLAILIACLGLFGLAAFTAEQRTKEIGIRKVLGASVRSIVALLSKDFFKLVLIAVVVAAPLAYLAMERWLSGFAYRIDLGVGVFLLAGAAALLIALVTVSYQALKAGLINPTEALRSE